MAIKEHPELGTILICDFDTDFKLPEMVKTRPVIVISPKIEARGGLCTVVALSTTAPDPVMPYHAEITLSPPLPKPFSSPSMWIKGDMVYAIAFHRLDFVRTGKDRIGKRIYRFDTLPEQDMKLVRKLILRSIGLTHLTKHL